MREPLRLSRPRPRKQLARIDEIRRDFHVRAFGEELARVNLDLSIEARLQYLGWMRELAEKNGVPRPPRRFEELKDAGPLLGDG
jgi:hypothetical protein